MKATVYSNKGKYRRINEDYAVCRMNEATDCLSFVVVDGMGGLDYGDLASKLTGDSIMTYIENNLKTINKDATLIEALEFADKMLEDFCMQNHCRSGVSVVLGVIIHNTLTFTWQGNGRIYHCSDNTWSQLTKDHKLYIGNGTYRLTRCLKGQGLRDDIPIKNQAIESGDRILACTDGLYEVASNLDDMIGIINTHKTGSNVAYEDDHTGILIEF